MIQHTSPISGIACHANQYVATAGYDNKVILWNAINKQAIAQGFHDHLANQCRFSPCGHYLLSTSSDYTARLWSVPTMKLLAVLTDHQDDVESAAFHPHKNLIATAARDHKVRIFDTAGKLIIEFSGHNKDVISVEWSQDGEYLISSSDDGTIKYWDVQNKKLMKDMDLHGVETDTIVITETGIIFAGNDRGEIVILKDDDQVFMSAHRAGIKRLIYNAANKLLVSLSYDRKLCLWGVANNGELKQQASSELPSIVWPRSCAFLNDEELVFATFGSSYAKYNFISDYWDLDYIISTPGINALIKFYDDIYTVDDAGIVFKNNLPIQSLPSLCNFFVRLEDVLLTGGQTGEIFNALTGEVIYQYRSPLNCAANYTVDDIQYVMVGAYTGAGIILAWQDHKIVFKKIIALHNNAVKGLAATNNNIFSVCATGAAAFHDVHTLQCVQCYPEAHQKIANGCAVLAGEIFASVGRDLKLNIFNQEVANSIATPHSHSIKCIASSLDGEYIATGGYNGLVAIYHLSTGRWTSSRPTISGISCVIFDEDNKQFLASSYDGKVYSMGIEL